MPDLTGTTTADLNLREGPGTNFPVLTILPVRTNCVVFEQGLGEDGNWLRVRALERDGFVHRQFVLLAGEGVRDGFLRTPTAAPPAAPLEPAEHQMIVVRRTADAIDKLVARTWNKCGGLIARLADELKIDPGVAVAVFAVEAGGRCFAADGRLLIRFENHLFQRQWGRLHPEVYDGHFSFNPQTPWTGHRWRPAEDQLWRDCHTSQAVEWQVFTFARGLDETAAKLSISMGAPQIVGFNYAAAGFESVHEMFDAFAASESSQVVAFFDFVQGPATNSRRVLALQTLDFAGFAAMYNGPGAVARYASLIQNCYDAYKRLRPA